MEQIPQIAQTIITLVGGGWLFNWLKDTVKESFKKIDELDRKVTKLEHEKEFREKYKINQ